MFLLRSGLSWRKSLKKYGAGNRVRTRDPLITNQVLYLLSYTGIFRGF